MANRLRGFLIAVNLLLFSLSGCAFVAYHEQLTTLKKYGASQQEKADYLKSQEESFYKLKENVRKNLLKKKTPKHEILSAYGDPILCNEVKEITGVRESCLYRVPTEYFSTDKIYLNFDKDQNLDFWEFRPAD